MNSGTDGIDSGAGKGIARGDFPFPITTGPDESPYLGWLRNHSNYMAARGLLDYLRAGGVLMRGMIINFLSFLPYLLAIAIMLALAHHWMLEHPFRMTWWVLGASLGWIVLFVATVPLVRVIRYNQSLLTGAESTVRQRDIYERSFGLLLLLLVAAIAFESLPWVLEAAHDALHLSTFSWQSGIAASAGGLALLSGSSGWLSLLRGVRKQVALVLVGLLGVLVPLLVVLSATDYLLYGLPPAFGWMLSPLIVPFLGVLSFIVVLVVGMRRRVFGATELATAARWLVVSVALLFTAVPIGARMLAASDKANVQLDGTLYRMADIVSQFARITDRRGIAPTAVSLLDAGVATSNQYEREYRALLEEDRASRLEQEAREDSLAEGLLRRSRFRFPATIDSLIAAQRSSERQRRFLAVQMPFVSVGYRLSKLSDEQLGPVRRRLTDLAHGALIDSIKARVGTDEGTSQLLLATLVGHYIADPLDGLRRSMPFDTLRPLESVRRRFAEATRHPAVLSSLASAAVALRASDTDAIAALVDQSKLVAAVRERFRQVPGTAERAELAGKRELAGMLTKDELIALALPTEDKARVALLERTQRRELLRAALPAFPNDVDSAFRSGTLLAARLLARMAHTGSTAVSREPDDSTLHRLAFYHSIAPLSSSSEPDGAATAAVDRVLPEREIAGAAGAQLADRALMGLDVDYLRNLAFGLGIDVPSDSLDSLVAAAMRDAAQSALLREFKALRGARLEQLVTDSSLLSPETRRRPYVLRSGSVRDSIWNLPPLSWPAAERRRFRLAAKALGHETHSLAARARLALIGRAYADYDSATTAHIAARSMGDSAIAPDDTIPRLLVEWTNILDGFTAHPPSVLGLDELARIAVAKYWTPDRQSTDELVAKLMFGVHGVLEQGQLSAVKSQASRQLMLPKLIFLTLLILVIWLGCWIAVDVNLTSIHGLYRDRLASAFLVGRDTKGDIGIEDDIDLAEICRYEARSTAPYHIVNVALNLQASKDIGIRDRKSDFFFFSKRFIGGQRTGFCRSEMMEEVFPQMDLSTAMAISAAAAAPNMGRATSPLLVAFMTLLNVRLGFWVPNPSRVERERIGGNRRRPVSDRPSMGFTFPEVLAEELREIKRRRCTVYSDESVRPLDVRGATAEATVAHGLVGIGFSGGGIRSASFNLGLTQALHRHGVFDHCDYMSTVSGGGYLGSSLSTLMRSRESLQSDRAGSVTIAHGSELLVTVTPSAGAGAPRTHRFAADAPLAVGDGDVIAAGTSLLRPRTMHGRSEIDGVVTVEKNETGGSVVRVVGSGASQRREYTFTRFDSVLVKTGDTVRVGAKLIGRHDTQGSRFRWRIRPTALVREAIGTLNETHEWVNLSDGGHIENLAGIELLRRRCKYIILGDGEADPALHFSGLATLMRYASIDLGIRIDLSLDAVRLRMFGEDAESERVSGTHWVRGVITYPPLDGEGEPETGHLLYLKSSFTGDEAEVVREYRHRNPSFPHQSTSDQAFDEDQFEAYRALGQHVAEDALGVTDVSAPVHAMPFAAFEQWFAALDQRQRRGARDAS